MLHLNVTAFSLTKMYNNITLFQNLKSIFCNGAMAVDCFFIIAGFFLVLTFKSNNKFLDFIKKKYIRLSPVIIVGVFLCFLGSILHVNHFEFIQNILSIFLFNHFGFIWYMSPNRVLWFTSSLFFSLVIYYGIIRFCAKKYSMCIFLGLSIFVYLFLEFITLGRFTNPWIVYHNILNIGVLRSIAGVGMGCFIGQFYKNIFNISFNLKFDKILKIFITFIEGFLFFIFIGVLLGFITGHVHLMFITCFVVLLMLFILKKGYISEFFDKDIWVLLGKYQYSIFILHYILFRIFNISIWKKFPYIVFNYPFLPIIFNCTLLIIFTVFTYHLVEEPCAKYLKDKLFCRTIVQGENK